jgi:hypothetical protein
MNEVNEASPANKVSDVERVVIRLERYGVAYQGENMPICCPMKDGYWTPFHIANERLQIAVKAIYVMRNALEPYDDIKPRDWKTDREKLREAHNMAIAALEFLVYEHDV